MKSGHKRTGHAGQWQLQEAKSRFSQVVEKARQDGPQVITLRGRPAAVVLSVEKFQELSRPSMPLSAFFKASPLRGVELELERSKETGREVTL
ncbi:MAG: type II toxin-antitoxin system Phd/YefM family antitoxin [Geobacter sp.]|nr:type II toxin-antitoxin system Phd/YefM family antitoxin [Geobacter sp.]